MRQNYPVVEGGEWPMVPSGEISIPELPSGKSWPKISIVTPSFNQGDYIEKTIRSVLLQGYPNLEYIIIDGGSSDQSIGIIKKYESWINFWVSEQDRGQSHAINKGMEKATGELLNWLNSDDYLMPGALFSLAQGYLKDSTVGVIYGQGHIVNAKGNVVYTPELKQATRDSLIDWCFGSNFMQPSSLISRKAWLDFGPLDENFHYTMDVDLYLKISEKYRFQMINEVLTTSLSHGAAKTTIERNNMFIDFAVLMMRHNNEVNARKILEVMANRLNRLEEQDRVLNKVPMAKRTISILQGLGIGRRTEL